MGRGLLPLHPHPAAAWKKLIFFKDGFFKDVKYSISHLYTFPGFINESLFDHFMIKETCQNHKRTTCVYPLKPCCLLRNPHGGRGYPAFMFFVVFTAAQKIVKNYMRKHAYIFINFLLNNIIRWRSNDVCLTGVTTRCCVPVAHVPYMISSYMVTWWGICIISFADNAIIPHHVNFRDFIASL